MRKGDVDFVNGRCFFGGFFWHKDVASRLILIGVPGQWRVKSCVGLRSAVERTGADFQAGYQTPRKRWDRNWVGGEIVGVLKGDPSPHLNAFREPMEIVSMLVE